MKGHIVMTQIFSCPIFFYKIIIKGQFILQGGQEFISKTFFFVCLTQLSKIVKKIITKKVWWVFTIEKVNNSWTDKDKNLKVHTNK